MQAATKAIRNPATATALPSAFGNKCIKKTSPIKFCKAATGKNSEATSEKMEKSAAEKARGDSMASFGEGYATRSDDEGFGGIYGGNQQLPEKEEEEKLAFVNVPEYDTSQGSEVKEMEKARHQKHAES